LELGSFALVSSREPDYIKVGACRHLCLQLACPRFLDRVIAIPGCCIVLLVQLTHISITSFGCSLRFFRRIRGSIAGLRRPLLDFRLPCLRHCSAPIRARIVVTPPHVKSAAQIGVCSFCYFSIYYRTAEGGRVREGGKSMPPLPPRGAGGLGGGG
jgi:hypothetical protein